MTKQRSLMHSVLRLVPNFILEPIMGCLIGFYVFHIPHGTLGVAVSVPLIVAFLLSRVLALTMPTRRRMNPFVGLRSLVAASVFAVSSAVGTVMLVSSAAYRLIGLESIAGGAFMIAFISLTLAVIVIMLYLLLGSLGKERSTNFQMLLLWVKVVEVFWVILRFPTSLSMSVMGKYASPVVMHHHGKHRDRKLAA